MFDLRILMLHTGSSVWTDPSPTGNALLGRQSFSQDPDVSQPYQCETVTLKNGRVLSITLISSKLLCNLKDASVEGRRHSGFNLTDYHAVILVIGFIVPDLTVSYRPGALQLLGQICGEDFVRGKCVVVVTRKDTFIKAQAEKKITVSFLDWCRQQKGSFQHIFQEVQERFILFDNKGAQDVLDKQRNELVEIIDHQVLNVSPYTDIKFREAELRSQKLEKHLAELKENVWKENTELKEKTIELEEKNQADIHRAMERSVELEQHLAKLEEKTTELKEVLYNIGEENNHLQRKSRTLLTSPRLWLFLLVSLVALLITLLLLWPVATNGEKEIALLDKGPDLRRYVDVKLDDATKRFREIEKQLARLKIDG